MENPYKVGDLIHILPYESMGRQSHVNQAGAMEPWYDTIATVASCSSYYVRIIEDGGEWAWHFQNIEPVPEICRISNEALIDFL